MWTVAQLSHDLAAGRTSSRELVEQALSRIAAPYGEGARAFLKVYDEQARADADHADRLRKRGVRRSRIDGLPVGAPPTGLVTQAAHQGNTVALTLDDGPSAEYTPQILGVLRRYHARATFCMIGENLDRYPDLVRQVVADQVPGRHDAADLSAELGVLLHMPAEDVADADVHQVQVGGEHARLGALATALDAHDDEFTHAATLTYEGPGLRM